MSAVIIDLDERRARRDRSFNPYGLLVPAGLIAGIAFWGYICITAYRFVLSFFGGS